MADAAPGEICDVKKSVHTAKINEDTEVDDVLDLAFEYLANFERLENLRSDDEDELVRAGILSEPSPTRRSSGRSPTGEHLSVDSNSPAWLPIREDELGLDVEHSSSSSSLLDGLHRQGETAPKTTDPNGDGDAT